MMMRNKIYIFYGASATGKTTLVNYLSGLLDNDAYEFYNFDSIGIPAVDEMIKEYGSPTEWQKSKAREWIKKLVCTDTDKTIIFEGQMNPNFIRQAFADLNYENYRIILLDCVEEELVRRLVEERRQPELANADMLNWRNYLRKDALEHSTIIIDTTNESIENTGSQVISKVLM